jgi:acetyl esterase
MRLLTHRRTIKRPAANLNQVAENDILRDEGEAYGRKLDEAGVKVTCIRYNGVIHDFGLLNGLADIPQTKSLFVHAAAELKKYLCPEIN